MRSHPQANRAFTLIEVAIALGVIAFALVAIIGVLPSGMTVQRDNRQDTIINSDGSYLLEAIRTSAQNIPDLTNFVESVDSLPLKAGMTSSNIIALMSDPANGPHKSIFRSITGPAVLRNMNDLTFRYMVLSDVRQVNNANPDLPHAAILDRNTYEVRLVFLWPLVPNSTNLAGTVQKQVMRTTITGRWDVTNAVFIPTEFLP